MSKSKKKNYFEGVSSLEELKKMYHAYIKMYHPDLSGEDTTSIMAEINVQYKDAFKEVGTKHTKYDKQTQTYSTYTYDTGETENEFIDIINKAIHFKGCTVELVGAWLWITGNTRDYKDDLKNLGFRFCGVKQAWSYHKGKYHRYSKATKNMNELRAKWGNKVFENEEGLAIEG